MDVDDTLTPKSPFTWQAQRNEGNREASFSLLLHPSSVPLQNPPAHLPVLAHCLQVAELIGARQALEADGQYMTAASYRDPSFHTLAEPSDAFAKKFREAK